MSSTRHAVKQQPQPHSLNYFQQSPVRGQLEPTEGFSKSGWRYLQCTDTPNELRVLLPPRTAMIYAHLLRAEVLELANDKSASWDRIMEIRHLKDRMIRKCQRLSRGAAVRDKNTSRVLFFTVHAPPDFRMKEMERWFRSQGPEISQAEDVTTRTAPYCCANCSALPTQSRTPTQLKRSNSQRSAHTKVSLSERMIRRSSTSQLVTASSQAQVAPAQTRHEASPPPLPVPNRSRSLSRSNPVPRQSSNSRTPPYVPTPNRSRQVSPYGTRGEHPPRESLQSPDPVPIPYRTLRDSEEVGRDYEAEVEIPIVERSPSPIQQSQDDPYEDDLYADLPQPSPPTSRTPDPDQVAFPSAYTLETIPEGGDSTLGLSRPMLPRRRSSLKKSGSMSRLSIISQTKSVSWAMDRDWVDQMAKFEEVTKEAEASAHELENVRTDYREGVHEMSQAARKVTTVVENIRHDSEFFHREEMSLREQENKLFAAMEKMELKESEYHRKVVSVLEETKRVVHLCDKKRDRHDA